MPSARSTISRLLHRAVRPVLVRLDQLEARIEETQVGMRQVHNGIDVRFDGVHGELRGLQVDSAAVRADLASLRQAVSAIGATLDDEVRSAAEVAATLGRAVDRVYARIDAEVPGAAPSAAAPSGPSATTSEGSAPRTFVAGVGDDLLVVAPGHVLLVDPRAVGDLAALVNEGSEEPALDRWASTLPSGSVVVDLDPGCGTVALAAAAAVGPTGTVLVQATGGAAQRLQRSAPTAERSAAVQTHGATALAKAARKALDAAPVGADRVVAVSAARVGDDDVAALLQQADVVAVRVPRGATAPALPAALEGRAATLLGTDGEAPADAAAAVEGPATLVLRG